MPTVPVVAEELFERLGRPYTENELEELCFAFGVELDEVTEQEGTKVFKIDVPANRYDLLCVEGLGRALRVFTSETPLETIPTLWLTGPPKISVSVKPWAEGPRPFISAAVLRGVQLNPRRFNSLIELQDKLHHTLCRRRTLASIGTHDMRCLEPPFSYEALPPEEIAFRPLGCGALPEMTGPEILMHFSHHAQLKQYLHMLEGQPRLYLVRDKKGSVLSMPPLINGELTRVSPESRDIFIDVTAVDKQRGDTALLLVAAMFAEYCDRPFGIEPVRIIYEESNKEIVTPSLNEREMAVDMGTIRRLCGLKEANAEETARQLQRLMLKAVPDPKDRDNRLLVSVPPTRGDIMHACDVAEDVAIGIGYNRLPVFPAPMLSGNSRSLLTQSMRCLLTSLGYTECLNFALCSREENSEYLNKPLHAPSSPAPAFDPIEHQWIASPVVLSNAKTRELTETRTQLISGILKALSSNIGRREMPLKFYEIGDVVVRDEGTETKSRNLLYCCAAFADEHGSGLEDVHGLLDAAFEALGLVGDYVLAERQAARAAGKEEQRETHPSLVRLRSFSLKPTALPTFLPGRQVEILVNRQQGSGSKETVKETGKETGVLRLGHMGTLHVDCLRSFGLGIPVSVLEFTLEPFLHWLPQTDLVFA